ncbi:MAG: cysteine desulfurase, partial [Rhodovulum sp.]|nr:cysteine desulfurase [Rhodovulum sp.]
MLELVVLEEWARLAVRWLHVTTAIAWIGSSFYFIALDLGLRRDRALASGADGEEWQVHGGGFYHIQKFLVAPASLPEHLTWFKWESYATWLSGFAMLVLVYYLGADLYLVDPSVLDLPIWAAILISLGSLSIGWLIYDALCKSPIGNDNTRLMVLLYIVLVAMAWGYTQVFSGRAALLHLGAFTATIMSANVFLIIIPNQKVVVADLRAGRAPDPKYGKIAKQRSTHNNYLTLPVLFLMLSNHYPLAFASDYNWLIASLVFLMGVTIRHYFNTIHARKGNPRWTWAATAAIFAVIVVLSLLPLYSDDDYAEEAALSGAAEKFAASEHFEDVYYIVAGRCSMCHGQYPGWDGIVSAPRGVMLETEADIARHARQIFLQAG